MVFLFSSHKILMVVVVAVTSTVAHTAALLEVAVAIARVTTRSSVTSLFAS